MPMGTNPGTRLVFAGIAIALLAVMAAVVGVLLAVMAAVVGVLLGLMGILVGVIVVALAVVTMADALTTNPFSATVIAGVVSVLVGILGPNLDVQGLATRASSAVVSAVEGQASSVVLCFGVFVALFLLGLLKFLETSRRNSSLMQ